MLTQLVKEYICMWLGDKFGLCNSYPVYICLLKQDKSVNIAFYALLSFWCSVDPVVYWDLDYSYLAILVMDSKDVEESADHQSTMENNVEQSPSVNEVEQIQDNNQISLSRTSSITKSKEISIKTISTESSSDSSSSAVTLIQEIKPMTRRQIATVLILCFVNLLKYTDRFAIAGNKLLN